MQDKSIEQQEQEWAQKIAEVGVLTEAQMREATVPWPKTPEELTVYITTLVQRPHDYGTCVYAMSMAAVAAYWYAAHVLGVTGFQASCADMDILRRTRGFKGPFMVVDVENALYPQYDLVARLQEYLEASKTWLQEQAAAKLADPANAQAAPAVVAHWRKLAGKE